MNDRLPANWHEMSLGGLWDRLNDPRGRPTSATNKTTNTVGQNQPRLKSARASTYQIAAVKWLWPSRFAIGKLGILAGLPDEGKGQVLTDMAARTTRE
jgi:hypothetical protein